MANSRPASPPAARDTLTPSNTSIDTGSRSYTAVDPADRLHHQKEDVNSIAEREDYGIGEEQDDPFEVRMGPEDPEHPKSWSRPYRWYITVVAAFLFFNVYVKRIVIVIPKAPNIHLDAVRSQCQ